MILNVRLLKMKLNDNSENFFKWIFRKDDKLSSIVFLFISRINANNARFSPLFQSTQKIRIVYFPGLPIKYTDQMLSRIFTNLQKLLYSKIARYQSIHFFGTDLGFHNQIQILHIDDPVYSLEGENNLRVWEENNLANRRISKIITTNTYTANWLKQNTKSSEIIIIEQGFHDLDLDQKKQNHTFICGYSSPYIYYGKDEKSTKSPFNADVLINEIIPGLFMRDPYIEIYLIGKLGRHAKKAIRKYPNVVKFGRVDFVQNIHILAMCDIGIYPRKIDHKRSVLKIFTYLGAKLPIVTFDLIDTEIVKQQKLGLVSSTSSQFIENIIILKQSSKMLKDFRDKITLSKGMYSWKSLAQKMEVLLK